VLELALYEDAHVLIAADYTNGFDQKRFTGDAVPPRAEVISKCFLCAGYAYDTIYESSYRIMAMAGNLGGGEQMTTDWYYISGLD
jgi:hypothetical protein